MKNEESKMPRGLRNNNPLNIRLSKDRWQGQVLPSGSGEGAFCQFESMEWGWRAAFYLLTRNYFRKHGLQTIRGIIARWAPPQDHNNTEAYIRNVCKRTGIGPDEPLGIPSEKPARWMMLGIAMAIQENGIDSLDWFAMLRGWELLREG